MNGRPGCNELDAYNTAVYLLIAVEHLFKRKTLLDVDTTLYARDVGERVHEGNSLSHIPRLDEESKIGRNPLTGVVVPPRGLALIRSHSVGGQSETVTIMWGLSLVHEHPVVPIA